MNGITSSGAKGINALGPRYMGKYHPLMEIGPRYLLIQGTHRELTEGNGPPFVLDVAPMLEDDDSDIEINMKDVRVDTYHSSGAGGQNVNKTSSAVRMTHYPTGIVVSCQTERDQVQNRATCIKMLKAKLLELRERAKEEEMANIKGEMKKIEWGSQIRSYVFQPYTMVKDHRTNYESGNIDDVMDGNLEGFITAYLKMQ